MDNIKNDRYYRDRLLNDLNVISRHMTGVSEDDFASDELLQDAMMFRLIQASENARKLSDRFKADYPLVPWGDVYGLRNRIVHDYGTVDLHIVYVTLSKDIPALAQMIEDC